MAPARPEYADAVEAAGFKGITWQDGLTSWWGVVAGPGATWKVDRIEVQMYGCVQLSMEHHDNIQRAMRLLAIGDAAIAAALEAEEVTDGAR